MRTKKRRVGEKAKKKNKDRVMQVSGSGDRLGDIMGKRGHGQGGRNSE